MYRIFAVILGLLAPAAALAQSGGRDLEPAVLPLRMMGAGFGLLGIAIVLAVLVVPFAFWVMMVIDCTKREWPEKNMWLIVLWLSLFFGLYLVSALLYYFLVKRKDVGAPPTVPGQPPQPPAQR